MPVTPIARAVGAVWLLGSLLAPAVAEPAAPAAERFTTCLACHGPGGVSALPMTPSLAGQPSFYAITQLFLFREGQRGSEAMIAVAKGMSDADLRAFSDLIGKLPAAPVAAVTDADAARTAQAQRSPSATAARRATGPITPAVSRCHGWPGGARTIWARH